MPPRRHVAFNGLGLRDVHHGIEKVGFPVLATEVLRSCRVSREFGGGGLALWTVQYGDERTFWERGAWGVRTYAAYDGVVAGQMGFAMLAAKYLVRV